MSSRREIVNAGVHIICEELIGVLLKLKRQRQRQSMRRWILKRRNSRTAEHAENYQNRHEMSERQVEEQREKLCPNRLPELVQDRRNNCNIMNLRSTQLEYGDLTINDVSVGDENPLIFHVVPQTVESAIPNVTIKTEIKQEVQDIPEPHCNDSSASNSIVNRARGASTRIAEDGQQFATLCEVYMPPSPSSSKGLHGACNNSDDESIPDGIAALQKIKSLKREVSSLRMQLANLESGMRTFLGEDQLLYLCHKSSREFMWSESTIRKAKQLQAACGVKGYNHLCEMGFPLPGKSTVAHKMKQFSVKQAKKS